MIPVGSTALMWACASGHVPVVEVLVKQGVDMEARNNGHKSAALLASEAGHTDVVAALERAKDYEWFSASKREAEAAAAVAAVSQCDLPPSLLDANILMLFLP